MALLHVFVINWRTTNSVDTTIASLTPLFSWLKGVPPGINPSSRQQKKAITPSVWNHQRCHCIVKESNTKSETSFWMWINSDLLGALRQAARSLTLRLASYLAEFVAETLRAARTPLLMRRMLIFLVRIAGFNPSMLHAASGHNVSVEEERKRPCSGLVKIMAKQRQTRTRAPVVNTAYVSDWIEGFCPADSLMIWFSAHWTLQVNEPCRSCGISIRKALNRQGKPLNPDWGSEKLNRARKVWAFWSVRLARACCCCCCQYLFGTQSSNCGNCMAWCYWHWRPLLQKDILPISSLPFAPSWRCLTCGGRSHPNGTYSTITSRILAPATWMLSD